MEKRIVYLLLGGIFLFCLRGDADTVPTQPYLKDSHTLFLCHFDSAAEVESLGGKIAEGVTFEKGKFGNGFANIGECISFGLSNEIEKINGGCQAVAYGWKAGEIHHIACTWGKGLYLYFDGKIVASGRFEGGLKVQPKNMHFGKMGWWGKGGNQVIIDEVRISDIQRVFTQSVEEW